MTILNLPHGQGAVHYRLDGPVNAPVLVLSNSLGTTLEMWVPQLDALTAAFRVLRYDTRGHGGSSVLPGAYTLAQLGGDVLALLDALEIQRAHFCGISMGGLTGLWLGVHAPQRLNKLLVSNTAARIGTQEGWQSRAALVRAEGLDGVADSAASRWFTPEFVATRPKVVASLVDGLRRTPAKGYAACCDALAEADLREAIAGIVVPTLVLAGRHDPVTTRADADFIQSRVSGAQCVELPASHLSNIEASDMFNLQVLAFLQSEDQESLPL